VIGARASFSSEKLFRDMFFDAVAECGLNMDESLDKNMCYSFVLQHPDNRIVTPNKKPALCLVAIYSFEDKTNIIHHDIKPHNIVYNIDKNRINFIDFGHMRNIKTEINKSVQSNSWIYDVPYWNYPFEIQFLNKHDYITFAYKSILRVEIFLLIFRNK
jgi:serine/threonine protein kinase